MLDIIREAQRRFQEIELLLTIHAPRNSAYFAQLNEATQTAYIVMNEGMCVNTTVCHQCAEHRDFLRSMINVLDELESGTPLSYVYKKNLDAYLHKVTEILAKISAILSSF